jgi:hypothetical protein
MVILATLEKPVAKPRISLTIFAKILQLSKLRLKKFIRKRLRKKMNTKVAVTEETEQ